MSLYRLSLKNIWKILIFESLFSVLFCISMVMFLQIAFFSYEAAFILGLAISLIYSLIIYFGGDFPLLFTVKGGIRYIEISIMFFCGLLFITLPVFPFLSDGNILFALFDIICFVGKLYLWKFRCYFGNNNLYVVYVDNNGGDLSFTKKNS